MAYILACRRLGLEADVEKAARIYGVSPKLVKKRLRGTQRLLRKPVHVPVLRYRLRIEDAACLKSLSASGVHKACDRYGRLLR